MKPILLQRSLASSLSSVQTFSISVFTRTAATFQELPFGKAAIYRHHPPLTSTSRLLSVSAYSGIPSDGKDGTEILDLPLRAKLPKSVGSFRIVEVDTFQTPGQIEAGHRLMNDVIIEGKAWPFEPIFDTEEEFRGYFLSHAAFVVKSLDAQDADGDNNAVLGCFYIKPNFPGRCSPTTPTNFASCFCGYCPLSFRA